MAINLNPGADATLVTAAARAELAGAPADYSKTFESVALSYDRTMQAQANMWGNIAIAGAKIGKAINEDIATAPPEGTEYILEDLESTQDMLKQSYGIIKGPGGKRMNPFSKEARDLRRKARKERESLFATAEYELQGINAIESAHSSGMVDPTITGVQNMERSHAIVATRRGKTTDNGNYFKWEDVDGERKMVMYHDPSKIKKDAKPIEGFPYHMVGDITTDKDGRILDPNGQPIVTNAAEILKGLHGDQKDKNGVGIVRGAKSKSAASVQNMGFKSTMPFAQLDSHSKGQIQGIVDGEKNNRVSWFTASFADPNNRSFYDRVTNADKKGGSLISAEMYAEVARLSGLPTNAEGELQQAGVLKGLKDPSGDGYISQEEFLSADNMKIFSSSLFGGPNYDAEVTAGLYEQDQMRNYGSLFDSGHNKRQQPKNIIEENKSGLGKLTYANMFEGGKNMYIPEEEVKIIGNIGTSMKNRSKIGKGDNQFTWDSEKETYVMADGTIVPNKATLFKWLFKDQTLSPTFKESTFFKNIPEWDGRKWIKEEDKKIEDEPWYKFW